jgi:hypothetical protein
MCKKTEAECKDKNECLNEHHYLLYHIAWFKYKESVHIVSKILIVKKFAYFWALYYIKIKKKKLFGQKYKKLSKTKQNNVMMLLTRSYR